jgi:ribosomal protein S18 acetylase RimI-like enzyme
MEAAMCRITVMSDTQMTDYDEGAGGLSGPNAGPAIFRDAKVLEDTMGKAISTSPDSFLTTLVDVASKKADDWVHEIKSSTWVIAERDGEGVGVAACKPPEQGKDEESGYDSRYIESVWIDPHLRGRRLGERLIRYLMAAEYQKNPSIRQFLLWVFETNSPAINLYNRMNFELTGDRHDGPRPEIKYRLDVNHETHMDSWQPANEILLGGSMEKYNVTYRMLGDGDSA